MAEVSITLKGGPEYDAPWLVIKGDTVDEVGETLKDVRVKGVLAAIQAAGLEFKAQKEDGIAVRVIQQANPGAQVVSSQELPPDLRPKCETCGAPGVEKSGHSTKKNRDYRGIFCPNEHGPIEFTWVN
jgi:hypothetical protein